MSAAKPFAIDKWRGYEAYQTVKANAGAAGVAAIALLQWGGHDPFAALGWAPEIAGACRRLGVYAALRRGDGATVGRLLSDFFLPYIAIRDEGRGYAVSIVKAGAKLVGRDAGPVRTPLIDLNADQMARLGRLIGALEGASASAA